MKASGEAVLLVNSGSRRGQEWFEQSRDKLTELGVQLAEAKAFSKIDALKAAVEQSVQNEVPLVIVAGGDGTFSAVAHAFVGSKSTLGVLPLGTGNSFARDLGIVADVDTACKVVAGEFAAQVDLGEINDQVFVNVASMGLTARIAKQLTKDTKRKFGRFVYAIAIARSIREVRPFKVQLETNNGSREFDSMLAVIGTGKYHAGPFPLSPEASITNGKLTFYVLTSRNRADFVRYALALPTGNQGNLENVYTEQCEFGKMVTTPVQKVVVDGEVNMQSPLSFKVLPGAIQVMVPEDFEG